MKGPIYKPSLCGCLVTGPVDVISGQTQYNPSGRTSLYLKNFVTCKFLDEFHCFTNILYPDRTAIWIDLTDMGKIFLVEFLCL